jgi:predicted extracellular nuclease
MQAGSLIRVIVALAAAIGALALASPAGAASPNVVISQIYGGGGNSGAQYTNDFIELFNRGSAPVDLSAWSLQYASATGTGNFGANSAMITPLTGTLQPGQYQLVEEAGGATGAPLPSPRTTDTTPIAMAAAGGKVALVNTQTPLGCNGGSTPCPPAALAQIVDLVGYDGATFFEGGAPAPTLSNTTAAFRALAGCQDTDDNGADFSAAAPAPRTLLSPIVFCTPPTPHLAISQVYGGGGNSGATLKNDFIEIFNRGAAAVSLGGWSVQYASFGGTGAWTQTPLSDVTLQPGQYYLVQEAQGAGGTVDLPTPDATGTTPMSATAGKVALVSSILPLNGACPTSTSIADLVGYGAANCSEGSPVPTLSNTTAGLRNTDGCADTNNNMADFTAGAPTPRNTASPFKDCNADTAPSVTATTPASNASDVGVGANVSLTFSEPIDVHGSWYSISCGSSGSHTAAVSGGPTTFTLDPDTDFAQGESCTVTVAGSGVTDEDANDPPDTMGADYVFTFTTEAAPIPIHAVQGAAHISPYSGQVVKVLGIVTGRSSNGLWIQDPSADADPATSEGIFVFTNSTPTAVVGDSVGVSGRVQEFRPGGATNGNLTTTELSSPTVTVLSTGNPLPAPVVIGSGGRIPPDSVIEDDVAGSVETNGVFDPAQDGLDFYESLEGMRVQLDDAVAVGPTDPDFGETPVIGDDGANATVRTYRGGLLLRPDDGNPERVTLDDLLTPLPDVNVGDHYSGPIVGIVDYNFGNPFIEVTSPGLTAVHDGVTRERTDSAEPGELTISTFNFENLAPTNPQSKFDSLAGLIVDNLRSPDLIAGEEVQDNNGSRNDGVVDASQTLGRLVDAIAAAGGPTYSWREIDPVDDQDGGEPGGNIRQVFLFRTDRGLSFVDRPGGDSTTANAVVGSGAATHLQYSPGRIDPASGAWASSRKPLAGELDYRGHKLFVIANHFNSKGGDDPLRGRFQPPVRVTETQRHQQADQVADFVSSISAADPAADVVVLGDLNDFEFSETVQILEAARLHDLMGTLPPNQRYSYEFEGNAQVLDHVLFSGPLFARSLVFDPVHVNAEFFDQASDHDPSVVRVQLNDAPSSSAGGPYAVDEGSTVTLGATGTDPEGGVLSYAWDLDDNGSFETPGQSVAYSPDDGPSTPVVKVRATDDAGLTSTAQATVTVANVAPTVTALAASPPDGLVGQGLTFTGTATDPSTADTEAGFSWAFGTGNGFGGFGPNGFVASFSSCGTYTVNAKARDKDGGVSTPFTSGPVQVYDGDVLPPLIAGVFNLVQRGQVVPVKITVGCNGFLSGLHPAISVRAGDYDPTVDPGDPSYIVPDTASNADTGGLMREGNQQYLYNLGVPSTGSAGQLYTVLIRPFGGPAPTLYAVLKIRR